MKTQLTLLFTTLFFFSCSGDDDNSTSATSETFLDVHNNVVFECQNCPSQSDYSSPIYIGFTPSDNFLYFSSANLIGCNYIFEGDLNGNDDDWGIVSITKNISTKLTYTKTYSGAVQTFNYSTSGTSLNLIIDWGDGETTSYLYLVTELKVNDICN
jgi:hypothetical protein